MTLEFHKLTGQVEKMGQYLAEQDEDTEHKVDIALQILEAYGESEFLQHIHDRVQDAIDKDAGYRGARPIDEAIGYSYPSFPPPESATIIATDGSQILPDTHGVALYYLLNTGTIIVHHGSGNPPDIISEPYLFYESGYLRSGEYGLIKGTVVNARRTVAEMAALAEHTWNHRAEARPLIAFLDGPLLFFISSEVPDKAQLYSIYFSAMERIHEVNGALAGYTDKPRSRFVMNLLRLLETPEEQVNRSNLSKEGRLEGVQDIQVFSRFVGPGERTALFVQMSPQNKEFRRAGGDSHEIAFFYMNVAAEGEPAKMARIEIPMWVVEDREIISELQGLIYLQCQQLTSRYPYVLTRADELATVKRDEADQLDMLIRVAMTRQGMIAASSDKQTGKDLARAGKTRFVMK